VEREPGHHPLKVRADGFLEKRNVSVPGCVSTHDGTLPSSYRQKKHKGAQQSTRRQSTATGVRATAGIVKSMSSPIDLQATFIPNDGEFYRVKLALEIAIDEVVNEPGCIRYELTEATEEKLVLTEQWASEEDLAKHSKGIAVQDLNESLSALLAEPVKLERL
jgi:quinol monooxygenase YgiN